MLQKEDEEDREKREASEYEDYSYEYYTTSDDEEAPAMQTKEHINNRLIELRAKLRAKKAEQTANANSSQLPYPTSTPVEFFPHSREPAPIIDTQPEVSSLAESTPLITFVGEATREADVDEDENVEELEVDEPPTMGAGAALFGSMADDTMEKIDQMEREVDWSEIVDECTDDAGVSESIGESAEAEVKADTEAGAEAVTPVLALKPVVPAVPEYAEEIPVLQPAARRIEEKVRLMPLTCSDETPVLTLKPLVPAVEIPEYAEEIPVLQPAASGLKKKSGRSSLAERATFLVEVGAAVIE